MIVLNNCSKTIPISMCGSAKNARHHFDAFEFIPEHEKNGNVITAKKTSESKVA